MISNGICSLVEVTELCYSEYQSSGSHVVTRLLMLKQFDTEGVRYSTAAGNLMLWSSSKTMDDIYSNFLGDNIDKFKKAVCFYLQICR